MAGLYWNKKKRVGEEKGLSKLQKVWESRKMLWEEEIFGYFLWHKIKIWSSVKAMS